MIHVGDKIGKVGELGKVGNIGNLGYLDISSFNILRNRNNMNDFIISPAENTNSNY